MSTPSFDPTDTTQGSELEQLLMQAVSEPAQRPAFYRALMDATVLVLTDNQAPEGEVVLDAGSPLSLQVWEKQDGTNVLPFFSSLAALQRAVEREQPFMALPVRVLFEMTEGAELFLNPKNEYGKEFTPQEVSQLLQEGTAGKPLERVLEAGTEFLIGQPEHYPAAMVDALTTLFSQRKPVRRAFLALIHDKTSDERPNLLVGLEIDGASEQEIEQLIQEAGSVASEALADDEPVDFCLVNEKERGISHYLIQHTQAFYQRRWGSWLRNIIPSSGIA
ncbi:endopeptidase IV [Chimaeribacter californicus]|uniref:Endopeptidase IV n=1 Tax=Chimaeribacter californicus TaxID=2060067 RepID=A0A2N5E641_9GAMM|nr:enhanced serine sensitivity protein SseB [Chimaeribacter californicus]PLR36785.1 endopeptidase IV [Chimaeribacter californicus]